MNFRVASTAFGLSLLFATPVFAAANADVSVESAASTRNALELVDTNDPTYARLRRLRADGFLATYPSTAFSGRSLTRFEIARATNSAATEAENRLAQPATAQTVSAADVEDLRALLDGYGSDIDDLRQKLALLDLRTKQTASEQRDTATLLRRQKIGVQMIVRAPGIYNEHVTAYNGNLNYTVPSGTPGALTGSTRAPLSLLPAGTPLTFGNVPGKYGQNTSVAGDTGRGVGGELLRILFSGDADPNTSYLLRLENRNYFATPLGTSATTPVYCPSVTVPVTPGATTLTGTCSSGANYPNTSSLALNIASVTHRFSEVPGLSATAGRFIEADGPQAFGSAGRLGLGFEDYFNGGEIGYNLRKIRAAVGYGFGDAAGTNTGAATGTTGQSFFALGDYALTPQVTFGGSYLVNLNYYGQTYFNPSAPLIDANGFAFKDVTGNPILGTYQSFDASNSSAATVSLSYHPTDRLAVSLQGLHRFGNDPTTHSHFDGADAYWFLGQYGTLRGRTNGNFGEFGIVQTGVNSTLPQSKLTSPVGYEQFFLPAPNGFRTFYLGAHHWFGPNARIGLEYQNIGLTPNFIMPASSVSCPGCVITKDDRNTLQLETNLQF